MTHISNNSGNQEHYTPVRFIDSAREVMGSIDIDPASNEVANEWIKASTFYTIENQGLNKEWHGNIWMNPPYNSSSLKPLVDKLLSENINQAIVLTNNNTDTKAGQLLLRWASAICLVQGRIRFITQDGVESKKSPLQGQIIYYKGSNTGNFKEEFSKHGTVYLKD